MGFPLRFVFAIFRSSLLLIDFAIWRDAPLSDDLERLPRFAASAAPLPFAVSLILQAYTIDSRVETETDCDAARRAAAAALVAAASVDPAIANSAAR